MINKETKLICGMVVNTMIGNTETVWDLYEQYLRETRLYVTIAEYVEFHQPEVFNKLMIERSKLIAVPFNELKRIMEEPPLPGKAGEAVG